MIVKTNVIKVFIVIVIIMIFLIFLLTILLTLIIFIYILTQALKRYFSWSNIKKEHK